VEVADTRKRKKGKGESRCSAGCRLPVAGCHEGKSYFLDFYFFFPQFLFFPNLENKIAISMNNPVSSASTIKKKRNNNFEERRVF